MRLAITALILGCAIVGSSVLAPCAPRVEPPYLGELCIDPATDLDLEVCYGLPWYVTLEATAIFLE